MAASLSLGFVDCRARTFRYFVERQAPANSKAKFYDGYTLTTIQQVQNAQGLKCPGAFYTRGRKSITGLQFALSVDYNFHAC